MVDLPSLAPDTTERLGIMMVSMLKGMMRDSCPSPVVSMDKLILIQDEWGPCVPRRFGSSGDSNT
jgi:hypothetical protein